MRILNHELEVKFSARHKWTHFKIHREKHGYYKHLVWGKLSIIFGQPHLVPITVCEHCNEEIMRVGEDYLDYCEGCQSIEGPTVEITTEEYEALHG